MKNYILYILFIVILPTSFGDSDSSGCNSKKSDYSEEKKEQSQKTVDEKEKNTEKSVQKGINNDVSCCPFLCIE